MSGESSPPCPDLAPHWLEFHISTPAGLSLLVHAKFVFPCCYISRKHEIKKRPVVGIIAGNYAGAMRLRVPLI